MNPSTTSTSSFDLGTAHCVLARTPPTLDSLLRGLPDAVVRATCGPGTWSAFDAVGHLIHGERTDWIPRARRILEHGPAVPFDPFDRFAQLERDRGRALPDLLDEFASERRRSLDALESLALTPQDLSREGMHPALGRVTLGQLLATWVVHDLDHLAQVARTLAFAHRDDVGPWHAYLPVLPRPQVVEFGVRIAAPVEAAWRGLTTAEGLDEWFTQGASVDLRPGGSIRFRWTLPQGPLESGGDVIEVRPCERFVFRWDPVRSDPSVLTTVALSFAGADGGSTVRVRETGFPASDAGRVAFHDNATGWAEALTLLRFHLERDGAGRRPV